MEKGMRVAAVLRCYTDTEAVACFSSALKAASMPFYLLCHQIKNAAQALWGAVPVSRVVLIINLSMLCSSPILTLLSLGLCVCCAD